MSKKRGRRKGDYSPMTRTILEWMAANPGKSRGECARQLGLNYQTVKAAVFRYGKTEKSGEGREG